VDIFGDAVLKDDLGEAVTVAEIDEDDRAMVAPAMDPSHEEGAFARVPGAKLAAGMRAAQVPEKIEL
jgi:hypothetical protein